MLSEQIIYHTRYKLSALGEGKQEDQSTAKCFSIQNIHVDSM